MGVSALTVGEDAGEKAAVFVANEAVHTARSNETITLCCMILMLMLLTSYCFGMPT